MDSTILNLNKAAMDALREQKQPEAFELLSQAEDLLMNSSLQQSSKLWALTFNNLSSYYKQSKQLELALHYSTKALQNEPRTPENSISLASTYLSLSAIRSQLGHPMKAIKSALKAIDCLKHSKEKTAYTTVTLAYFALGKEYEKLHQIADAMRHYRKGIKISTRHVPENRQLIDSLRGSVENLMIVRTETSITPKRIRTSRTNRNRRKVSLITRENKQRNIKRTVIKADKSCSQTNSRITLQEKKALDRAYILKQAENKAHTALMALKQLQGERENLALRAQMYIKERAPLEIIPEA